MTTIAQPEAVLSALPRADGSATYSHAGYTVTASVNGPIEAQRRDEHPSEAHLEVIVRPAAGVGGTRERHLESLLQSSLAQLVLIQNFPRSLLQVVLQIETTPVNDYVSTRLVQASVNLCILPALLNAAVLAILSASLPMRATATSTVLAVASQDSVKQIIVDPSPRDAQKARSVHVLAFTSRDELLLAESEGDFSVQEWDDVYEAALKICCQAGHKTGIDMVLDDEETPIGPDMRQFLRSTMEAKVANDLHWK